MGASAAMKLVDDTDQAQAMLHPLRLAIVEQLAEPDSASGLARRLDLPRQKINYHLRELEAQGLVEFVEERRKGNCVERIVRASARSYLIDPGVLGALAAEPDKIADKFSSAYLVATAAKTIRDLAVLRPRADKAGKKLSTFTLLTEIRFATPKDRAGFTQELAEAIAQLTSKYHDDKAPGGRWFRFMTGAYPAVTKRQDRKHKKREEKRHERKRHRRAHADD